MSGIKGLDPRPTTKPADAADATGVTHAPAARSVDDVAPPALPADRLDASGPSVGAAPPTSTPIPSPTDLERERAAMARFNAEMPIHSQGSENSCGTTSLAMSLAYLGVPADFAVIDAAIRFHDPGPGLASVPGDLARFARSQGVQAEHYDGASLADLEANVRAGRPTTVLLNYQPESDPGGDGMAHYLNVIGFDRDASGRIEGVVLANPWGQVDHVPVDRFMAQWTNVSLTRTGLGAALPTFNRTMVVLDRPENPPLPSPGAVSQLRSATTNAVIGGVSGLSASVETIKRGHVVAGVGQAVGASINTVVGGAGYVIGNLIGQNVERGGEVLIDQGLKLLEGGLPQKALGVFALVAGGILKALGFLLSLAGGLVAEAGRLASTPFTALAEAQSRRDETREMLLNPRRSQGIEDPAVVLRRASVGTRARLLDNLLAGIGAPGRDDERAALLVLRSAEGKADELRRLAEPFGGPAKLLARFSGAEALEVARLYGLPAPAATGTPTPVPAPA